LVSSLADRMASTSLVTPGCAYLVGAGPGGLGCLTVRAVQVLSGCDVVLYDRLVPQEVVRLAGPSAEVRYVGKEGNVDTDKMKVHQDEISGQIAKLAREGKSVCRLKGGDPMIFGRVGEEMEELVNAGVPFEIVPAVTACLAAAADARVPLTFRNASRSLRILTMNPTTTKDANFDWSQFTAPSTTYALYMGLSAISIVCENMMAAGVPGSTPMAVVDRASTPHVQVVAGTVDSLPAAVQGRTDLPGPALVLLGEVVGLRERLGGTSPPAPPEVAGSGAALACAMSALPAMDDDALLALRGRMDEVLAARRRARDEPVGVGEEEPPAARRRADS